MSYTELVELLHSGNGPGITCDHELEVIRAGEVSGTSRMGCTVEPAHVHTEKPYNPCGYRVSSYLWLRNNTVADIQQWQIYNGESAGVWRGYHTLFERVFFVKMTVLENAAIIHT